MSETSAFAAYRSAGLIDTKQKSNIKMPKVTKKKGAIKKTINKKKNLANNDKNVVIDSIIEELEKEFNSGKKHKTKNKLQSFTEPPMAVLHNGPMKVVDGAFRPSITHTPMKMETEDTTLLYESSVDQGKTVLKWILDSYDLDTFFKNIWEQNYLHVKRNDPKYFSSLISITKIDTMLRQNRVEFTKNIDITSYEEQNRLTHNPMGRAMPPVVWDYYKNGCSIRLINPQTFIPKIHKLNATLQEYFQCMTGANVYLTPANSQGFAPHYDDIEAFVLQVEGKKRWKIYKPRNMDEILPRVSSENFKDSDIGEPIFEVILEPGDVLYFPRGFIHQASTVPGLHSLHITLSVYQKNSWGDLMELVVPKALSNAIANDVEFRQGLPMQLSQHMGIVYSDQPSKERTLAIEKLRTLFNRLFDYALLDDGVDAIQKKFQRDALPPVLNQVELARSVFGMKPHVITECGDVKIAHPIDMDTKIRLLRLNILRLVKEDDKILIYYSSENSKEYHEYDQNFLEIDEDDAPMIDYLIKIYPEFCLVSQLPNEDEKRLNVCSDLWERGLLITEKFLNNE